MLRHTRLGRFGYTPVDCRYRRYWEDVALRSPGEGLHRASDIAFLEKIFPSSSRASRRRGGHDGDGCCGRGSVPVRRILTSKLRAGLHSFFRRSLNKIYTIIIYRVARTRAVSSLRWERSSGDGLREWGQAGLGRGRLKQGQGCGPVQAITSPQLFRCTKDAPLDGRS